MHELPNMQPLGTTAETMHIPSYDSLTGWQLVEMIIADYESARVGKETV